MEAFFIIYFSCLKRCESLEVIFFQLIALIYASRNYATLTQSDFEWSASLKQDFI